LTIATRNGILKYDEVILEQQNSTNKCVMKPLEKKSPLNLEKKNSKQTKDK
jgi:hypothetical protein